MKRRKYKIQFNSGREYQAGIDSSNHAVLMGYDGMDVVAVRFNSAGRLVQVETRPIAHKMDYERGLAETKRVLQAWQNEIGFRPATIEVERFSIEGRCISIEDIPNHYIRVKDDPERILRIWESIEEYESDLQDWIDSGSFVLNWGNDFWIKKNGEFESS